MAAPTVAQLGPTGRGRTQTFDVVKTRGAASMRFTGRGLEFNPGPVRVMDVAAALVAHDLG